MGELLPRENALLCSSCVASFPVSGEIPILVADAEKHLRELEEAVRKNAAWYESSQLAWYDHGPCRYHLARRRRYVESVLRHRLGAGGQAQRLLDLGCGDGANTRWLVEFASEIDACDYNLLRLRRCQRLLGARARLSLCDVHHLPWGDARFDVVFFNHVLEHIRDDVGALRSVRRVLRPEGLVILGVPNAGCACMQLAYRLQPALVAGSDHVQTYTAPLIEERCRTAGFEILETRHIGYGPPHLKFDERIRRYRRVENLLEWVGSRLFTRQSTSLYLLLTKK